MADPMGDISGKSEPFNIGALGSGVLTRDAQINDYLSTLPINDRDAALSEIVNILGTTAGGQLLQLGSGDGGLGSLLGIGSGIAQNLPGQGGAFNRDVLGGLLSNVIGASTSNIGSSDSLEGRIAAGQEKLNELLNKPVTEMTEEEKSIYTEVTGITPDIQDLSTTNLENDLLNDGVDMLDPNVTGLGGDESIVTDDEAWDAVDKTKDLASIFQDALDIFGAYDRNSIRKVVDVVNERGVSAQDVARITGNTVESINQAAAESGTAINNQGTAGDVVEDTGDVFNEATDTLNTGEVLTTGGGIIADDSVVSDDSVVTEDDAVVTEDDAVVTEDDEVIPVLDTPVIAEDPNVIVNDTPILPTLMQPTPKQTTNISLFQSIQDTPITDSLFFEPKFTELDNIPVGMFERFLQATGGR